MRRRIVLLTLLAIELGAGAVLYRGGWLSRSPVLPAVAPPATIVAEPPMPPTPGTRVKAVDVRRGDTLVRALERGGMQRDTSAGIAAALAASGANLRKLSPRHTLEVTWTLDGRPIALRYEPSPWLGYAVIPTDGGWEVHRAETRPDVRVDVVAGGGGGAPLQGRGEAGGGARAPRGPPGGFPSAPAFSPPTPPRGPAP